jgi:hypothetical protein
MDDPFKFLYKPINPKQTVPFQETFHLKCFYEFSCAIVMRFLWKRGKLIDVGTLFLILISHE